ncbi:MAG TPA: hypothetical protein VJ001_01810 [Rhodocyclaceae bacterium]|nr:hypothetical protein [Rhodocyclaceae bacterium]
MLFRWIFFVVVAIYPCFAWSACPPHTVADSSRVKFDSDAVLIVTHASSTYDARYSTKRGVDEAVRFAKSQRIPVVYLQDDTPDRYYFMEDCNPDYWLHSQGGEIDFEVTPTQVYIVGGHLEMCLSETLYGVLRSWAKKTPRNLTITYFMDAVYSNGKEIDPADPFYPDFVRFMDIVTYGRPGGEHWPKLTLLETMGVIVNEDHELDYIKQILPRWGGSFLDNYRVVVQMNDSVKKVIQSASGWRPPTLRFHFIDSALNLTTPLTYGF